jgi:hypothetical protein
MKKIDVVILLTIAGLLIFWYWKKNQDDLEDRLPDKDAQVKPPSILQANLTAPVIATPTQFQQTAEARIPMPRNATPVAAPVTDARALVNKVPPAYAAN